MLSALLACHTSKKATDKESKETSSMDQPVTNDFQTYVPEEMSEYVYDCLEKDNALFDYINNNIEHIPDHVKLTRRIEKRPPMKEVPEHSFKLEFFICITPDGDPALVRPVLYTGVKDPDLPSRWGKALLQTKFEADRYAPCLECGTYTYRIEKYFSK